MAPALSTTKRKFHKILDSISNASSTSLASNNYEDKNASTTTLSTNLESPSKRVRVTRPISAVTNPVSSRTVIQIANTRTTAIMDETGRLPNFAPWDRGQFLQRLQTFRQVDKWMGKPYKINEVKWAKRGWSCVGKERVGCVGGCGKEVVIKLEEDREERDREEDESAEEENQEWREGAKAQLIQRYAEMITTEHDGGCLWRRRGCDDTIHRLPLAHQATALSNLRIRYESLAAISSELPLTLSTPTSFDKSIISQNMSSILSPSQSSSITSHTTPTTNNEHLHINTPALTLALFGWETESSSLSGIATCTACFRRLGLWLFRVPEHAASLSTSPPPTPVMARLDVITEHRDYCPWVNPHSQSRGSTNNQTIRSSTSELAGWEILLRVVKNAQPSRVESFRPSTPETVTSRATRETSDGGDEIASVTSGITSITTLNVDRETRDEKDKERWAKLKKLKQVFHIKRGKGKVDMKSKLAQKENQRIVAGGDGKDAATLTFSQSVGQS